MKIVVASQNPVKLDAVKNAIQKYDPSSEVIGVKAASGVAEQPFDDETAQGARNRARHARQISPGADIYIAIENGIFNQDDKFLDKAAVFTLMADGSEYLKYSRSVELPKQYVEEARARGFDTTTVGKVMQDAGAVTNHADPHADLGEKIPRARLLQHTVEASLQQALGWTHEITERAAKPRYMGYD